MNDKKHDNQIPRPQRGEHEGKAVREGALQEGLHLAPNQPPENSVLPPTNTGGEGGEPSSEGGSSSNSEE